MACVYLRTVTIKSITTEYNCGQNPLRKKRPYGPAIQSDSQFSCQMSRDISCARLLSSIDRVSEI